MLGSETMFRPDLLDPVPQALAQLGRQTDVLGIKSNGVLPVEVLEQEGELFIGEGDGHLLQPLLAWRRMGMTLPVSVGSGSP